MQSKDSLVESVWKHSFFFHVGPAAAVFSVCLKDWKLMIAIETN